MHRKYIHVCTVSPSFSRSLSYRRQERKAKHDEIRRKYGENNKHGENSKLSLVPRPPPFLPSVCIHNNTWERKTGENGEGLGAFIM